MRHSSFLVAVLTLAGSASYATAARAADAPPGESPPSKMRVTALFVPAPLGRLHSGSPGDPVTVGSEPAFGFATAFDFVPHPHAFVGFGAGDTFHIVARETTAEPHSAFDLTVRFGGSLSVRPKLTAYGYVAPGYSFVQGTREQPPAQGPIVGVHAGALLDLTPIWFVALELGYQAGFQRAWVNQTDIAFSDSFFQTGLGLGARI